MNSVDLLLLRYSLYAVVYLAGYLFEYLMDNERIFYIFWRSQSEIVIVDDSLRNNSCGSLSSSKPFLRN